MKYLFTLDVSFSGKNNGMIRKTKNLA